MGVELGNHPGDFVAESDATVEGQLRVALADVHVQIRGTVAATVDEGQRVEVEAQQGRHWQFQLREDAEDAVLLGSPLPAALSLTLKRAARFSASAPMSSLGSFQIISGCPSIFTRKLLEA